jgi:hypothetical protein
VPSTQSCRKLAEYSGTSIDKVLEVVGYIPELPVKTYAEWPEFREYAHIKYPDELDEDVILMLEKIIELRRKKNTNNKVKSRI